QFSTSTVVVGIAGLRAITREIDIPFVPDSEVDSAVRFQSEEVIPFPPDQTILSSQVLSDYTSEEGDKMRRVLVAAAHADLVNGVIDVVEKGGLTVEGVDLISSALVRAIGNHEQTEQPEAIVSVGAGLTVVVVHQGGRPQFVRTVGAGGNATTAAISAALDVPINDAEAIKRRMFEDSPQMQSADRAAQPSMQDVVSEIKNSIQYFASLPDRLPVSRLLITGGGSELHGFVQMLEEQVRLPVVRASPLARVDYAKLGLTDEQAAEVGSVLSSPIGLALPERDTAVKKFNLIPPEVARRMRLKRIQERTVLAAAAVLVLLLGFGAWKLYKVHSTENAVSNLQDNIATLNAQVPKYDAVVAANTAYTAGLSRRTAVESQSVDWPLTWNQLVGITPAGAAVTSFVGQTATAATAGGSATATPASGSTTASSTSGTAPTSASIGTVDLGVTGPGPDLSISQAWINAIAGSQFFANPLQGATISAPGSNTIAFPFTVSITPNASLQKNASLK
ncbi:MAG: type IV pilus assembly protein PilM, partial [Acidimicrobiales bacterium]|nr:type IV pilus assembly protein PilM [Acidimicrobiales bacterium]